MKNHLLIYIFLFSLFFSTGYTVNGGVSYTINEARNIAFNSIKYKIDTSVYQKYFTDENYIENKNNVYRHKLRNKKYKLTLYSDETYSICYKSDKTKSFYYDTSGQLESIGFIIGEKYPKKGVKYSKSGLLIGTYLIISSKEQFIFDKNKKLIGHWIGQNCYNEKGELVLIRY